MKRKTTRLALLALFSVLMTMVLSGCVLNSYYVTFDEMSGQGYLVHDTGISESYMNKLGQTPEEYYADQLAQNPNLYHNTINGVTYYYTEQARKDPDSSFDWKDYDSIAGESNPLIKRTQTGSEDGFEYIDLYLTVQGLNMKEAEGSSDVIEEFRDEFVYYTIIDSPGTFFRDLESPYPITTEYEGDLTRLCLTMPIQDDAYEVKVSMWTTYAENGNYPRVLGQETEKKEDEEKPEEKEPEQPAAPETETQSDAAVDVQITMDIPKAGMYPQALSSACKVTIVRADGTETTKSEFFDMNDCMWLHYIGEDPEDLSWMSYEVEEMKKGDTFKIGDWYRCAYYVDLKGAVLDPAVKAVINEGKGQSYWIDNSSEDETGLYLYWTYGPVADPFKDVPKTAYYKSAVEWAFNHEPQITDGMSPTSFGPDKTCTRGQVVTFLWRAAGCPKPETKTNPFTDVKESDYFFEPVLWAVEQGITDGTTPTTFSPAKTCRNNHILTFIWRSVGKPGDTNSEVWYADAYKWAETNGLLKGTFEGEYDVSSDCPRRDVVEYLYRHFCK